MIGPFIEPEVHPESSGGASQPSKPSKIMQRKQIEKRLQGLKPTEYEKIVANLTTQNEKLQMEVDNINSKVEELVDSKKITKSKNPQIEQ